MTPDRLEGLFTLLDSAQEGFKDERKEALAIDRLPEVAAFRQRLEAQDAEAIQVAKRLGIMRALSYLEDANPEKREYATWWLSGVIGEEVRANGAGCVRDAFPELLPVLREAWVGSDELDAALEALGYPVDVAAVCGMSRSPGILVKVRDGSGGVLPNAAVEVSRDGAPAIRATTNWAGQAIVSVPETAEYSIAVSLPGFCSATERARPEPGCVSVASIVLALGCAP